MWNLCFENVKEENRFLHIRPNANAKFYRTTCLNLLRIRILLIKFALEYKKKISAALPGNENSASIERNQTYATFWTPKVSGINLLTYNICIFNVYYILCRKAEKIDNQGSLQKITRPF